MTARFGGPRLVEEIEFDITMTVKGPLAKQVDEAARRGWRIPRIGMPGGGGLVGFVVHGRAPVAGLETSVG